MCLKTRLNPIGISEVKRLGAGKIYIIYDARRGPHGEQGVCLKD